MEYIQDSIRICLQRYAECNMHGAKEANVSAEEIDSFKSVVFDDK